MKTLMLTVIAGMFAVAAPTYACDGHKHAKAKAGKSCDHAGKQVVKKETKGGRDADKAKS
jgi:hypothetical protein